MREVPLVTNEVYHILNKSIAGYVIFNNEEEFLRMLNAIRFCQREKPGISFSKFFRPIKTKKKNFSDFVNLQNKKKIVEIIAYCLMPTHFHLILKEIMNGGISTFMNNVENSYSRYFNLRHNRKGPLWEGRFKNVLVKTDEQLLLLTRYVHLNPATACLVHTPEEWLMSSYNEYLLKIRDRICKYDDILGIEPGSYRRFVNDRISYQRELAKIKDLLLE